MKNDDDRIGHGQIIVGTLVTTLIFLAEVSILDRTIILRMAFVSVGVGVFVFLFSEFINSYSYHQIDEVD